jgi:hypothetical protein
MSVYDQWLADYERRIVTMWTVAAFALYTVILAVVMGLLIMRDVPVAGARALLDSKLLAGERAPPSDAPAASTAAQPTPTAEINIPLPDLVDPEPIRLGFLDIRSEQRPDDAASLRPFVRTAAGIVTGEDGTHPTPALMTAIASWLASNYDLPAIHELPKVELVTQLRLATLRFRGLASDRQPAGQEVSSDQARNVVAVYDDVRRTIYLQEGWSGTPAEISVVVHEMVHHIQNVGNVKYECPQAREKPAYLAQQRWLQLAGLDLLDEFEIDPMTVLVRSLCVY